MHIGRIYQFSIRSILSIVDRPDGRLVNSINVHCSSSRSKIGDAKTFASCNFYDVLNAKLLWHLIATDNDALTQWSEINNFIWKFYGLEPVFVICMVCRYIWSMLCSGVWNIYNLGWQTVSMIFSILFSKSCLPTLYGPDIQLIFCYIVNKFSSI